MITVKEKFNGNEIYFEYQITNNNNTITNKIYYKSVIKEKNDTTYLMLYDTHMSPISDVFSFLNYNSDIKSINTKIKSLQALKLLHSYQYIVAKNLEDFTMADINNLKLFLKGYTLKGQTIQFELITNRSNETVNGYLSVYRQYLTFLNKTNKALMAKSSRSTSISLPDSEIDFRIEQYASSEKVVKKVIEVPMYISFNEFEKIITLIRNKYTIREEIIVRLMYQCGLRIGEVLGITADDLVVEQIEGVFSTILYIRNRFTDKIYQHAKTYTKIFDRKQYKSDEYNTYKAGYDLVVIPEDLYNLINTYIEEVHSKARKEKKENYYRFTIADRVRPSEPYEDDNYYVFINSLGKPLSATLWNDTIREIYIACNIPIDSNVKKNNLNHRLRHGFSMFQVQYLNCSMIELKSRLRHKSLQSVSCYYRPTISDAIKIKTDFANSLYDIFPDLQRSVYDERK